ncbi:MAG: cytidine deaminase [bacterium]|nr:cytidine deaminase [bacterium]
MKSANYINQLVKKALEVRENAYAPYSKTKVGAAILTKGGKIFTGCNVENASLGLSLCAERVTLFKAMSEGEYEFVAIAIVADDFFPPCGACRQVLHEFAKDIEVILVNEKKEIRDYKLSTLFPHPFK